MCVSVFGVKKKDLKNPSRFTAEIRVLFALLQKPLFSHVKPVK